MFTPVSIATVVGTAVAAIVLWVTIRWLGNSNFLLAPGQRARRAGKLAAVVAGVVSFPFAWFVGYVVGGNFGGAYASRVGREADLLIPIGIGTGILLVTVVVSLIIAVVAFVCGRLLERQQTAGQ